MTGTECGNDVGGCGNDGKGVRRQPDALGSRGGTRFSRRETFEQLGGVVVWGCSACDGPVHFALRFPFADPRRGSSKAGI